MKKKPRPPLNGSCCLAIGLNLHVGKFPWTRTPGVQEHQEAWAVLALPRFLDSPTSPLGSLAPCGEAESNPLHRAWFSLPAEEFVLTRMGWDTVLGKERWGTVIPASRRATTSVMEKADGPGVCRLDPFAADSGPIGPDESQRSCLYHPHARQDKRKTGLERAAILAQGPSPTHS